MKIRSKPPKIRFKAERTIFARITLERIMLTGCVILALLMMNAVADLANSSDIITDNASENQTLSTSVESEISAVNISVGGVANISDNETLRANNATAGTQLHFRSKRATPAERRAAGERFKEIHQPAVAKSLAAAAGPAYAPAELNPGGVPHYFGPYANWANSPMPKGAIANISVVDGGSG